MALPEWNQTANGSDSFGQKGRLITPAGTDLDPIAKSVYMLTAGDITFMPAGQSGTLTASLPAGAIIPYRIRQVTACTGTCATID